MRWLFQSRGRPGRTLPEQLREAALGTVQAVVLSHQHEDHTGTLDAFKSARVVSGAAHAGWEQARFEARGPAPFDASQDLFGDGCVLLIPGGGHTREDVMALLALPEGPALLTGDAVVHFSWLESEDVERIAVDAERAATVRNQVRAFLRSTPHAVVIPGHDLSRLPQGRSDIELHHVDWFSAAAWPTEGRSWFN
jgi:glyoxylase-like metal-dependent hydrolase (beta-lactamase superfamily II)